MSATLLTAASGPTINNMEAGVLLSKTIIENVVMDTLETEGRGITQSFDEGGERKAQIKAIRLLPLKQKARRRGAGINGGNFNALSAEQPESEVQMIDVLDVIDGNIDIPNMVTNAIDVNILDQKQLQIAQLVSKTLNEMTIAGKIAATFNAEPTFVEFTTGTTKMTTALLTLAANLDEGDEEHGIQYFPDNDRVYIMRSSFKPTLLAEGIYSLGGANKLYDMVAKGTASPETTARGNDGYVGEFNETPIHCASSQVWAGAAAYLGIPDAEIKGVYGYCSSAFANARAVGYGNTIKIIDSPDGAGIRLQPCYAFGFASWYPKGNQFLVKNGYSNPITAVNTALSLTGANKLKLACIPAGSRQYATFAWDAGGDKVTVTAGTGCTISKAYYCAVAKANAASELTVAAVNATTKNKNWTNASLTSGTEATLSITGTTAGDYKFYLLVVMADGTEYLEVSDYTKA